MKHKGIIIISTVLIFLLASILSFVWLFKVRHIEIDVVAISAEKENTYEEVDKVLERNFGNRPFFAVKENEVKEILSENPYIKVLSVKKVFPDRIKISVEKRIERFSLIAENSVCYVTDSEYVLLRKETEFDKINEKIIKMTLSGINLDESTLKEGEKIGYGNDKLVGYMTTMFSSFTDGINFINEVTVKGKENRIVFNAKTGVTIEFRFAPSSPGGMSEEQIKQEELAIVGKVKEVENYYLSLTEKEQRSGSILVLTKSDGEITIYHSAKSVNWQTNK